MAKQKADDKKMTKADAVRAAVANGHALPKAGVKFIKDEFGIDITVGTFSATKSQQGNVKKGSKPKGGVNPIGIRKTDGTPVELARSVKSLVDVYGVEAVKEMAALFAK